MPSGTQPLVSQFGDSWCPNPERFEVACPLCASHGAASDDSLGCGSLVDYLLDWLFSWYFNWYFTTNEKDLQSIRNITIYRGRYRRWENGERKEWGRRDKTFAELEDNNNSNNYEFNNSNLTRGNVLDKGYGPKKTANNLLQPTH